jgi:hypothetical protein
VHPIVQLLDVMMHWLRQGLPWAPFGQPAMHENESRWHALLQRAVSPIAFKPSFAICALPSSSLDSTSELLRLDEVSSSLFVTPALYDVAAPPPPPPLYDGEWLDFAHATQNAASPITFKIALMSVLLSG